MASSSIEWTEMTWNPTTGCTKISEECKFCYAEIMSRRLKAMGVEKYSNGFKISTHPESLEIPFSWKKPKLVFVNSMSDLFHQHVPLKFIQAVFRVMNDCPQHSFQVLTKRADRLAEVAHTLTWSRNIWMGVSVENDNVVDRVDFLRQTPAHIKFLSVEPLIGPVPSLNVSGIDWVIVGGESGIRHRPIQEAWVIPILNQCKRKRVPFFFKQWGGRNKKKAGRILRGQTFNELPKKAVHRQNVLPVAAAV